jgi:hypothetical protein
MMALSIGVSQGTKIIVDKYELLVEDVPKATHVQVLFRDKRYIVTDEERIEIYPNVFLSCGLSDERKHDHNSRLAFEAPRSIFIERVGRKK